MGAGHSSRHREKARGEAQETGAALGTGQEAEISPRTSSGMQEQTQDKG